MLWLCNFSQMSKYWRKDGVRLQCSSLEAPLPRCCNLHRPPSPYLSPPPPQKKVRPRLNSPSSQKLAGDRIPNPGSNILGPFTPWRKNCPNRQFSLWWYYHYPLSYWELSLSGFITRGLVMEQTKKFWIWKYKKKSWNRYKTHSRGGGGGGTPVDLQDSCQEACIRVINVGSTIIWNKGWGVQPS